jgi:hypothetical protein
MTGEASQQQKRKDDTRRKIIAGAIMLEHAETNAAFAAELTALLNHYVTKPQVPMILTTTSLSRVRCGALISYNILYFAWADTPLAHDLREM